MNYQTVGDPETHTRIQQYEMAFRMQASVPELTDLAQRAGSPRSSSTATTAKKPGTFANTVLLARRMVERGVRFVQIYHNNWDTHGNVAGRLPDQCRDVDQACYGLIQDLKSKGMFDSTLVIWGGEFGRTIYSQGGLTKQNYGRDHHPRCFTMWMAGGGVAAGHDPRRDRRLLLQHRQGPGPHPRLPRHGAAPARLRPRRSSPTAIRGWTSG